MAWTHDVRPVSKERREVLGPQVLFAVALALAVVAWLFIERNFHTDLAMPLAVTLLFAAAAAAAPIAWMRGGVSREQVNYWDVAGALTLIGICAAATIDPEQLVRIVETTGAAGHQDARISDR